MFQNIKNAKLVLRKDQLITKLLLTLIKKNKEGTQITQYQG